MKLKSLILGLFIATAFVACKNEPKTDEANAEEAVDTSFKVTLNLNMKKNDTLHLYYTEDNTINFKEESSLWVSAAGSEQAQDMVFKLPDGVFPTQFRLDLGVNRENEKIKLNSIKFDYLKKSFLMNETTIFNYFRIDENVSIMDPQTKELGRKDPKVASGASLYPQEIPLKTEIDKLAK